MKNTNWLAIIAASIAGFFIGFLWYGLLFQDQWMSGNGISMQGETMLKNGTAVEMSSVPMIFQAITMLVFALLLNWLINQTNHTTATKGGLLGVVVGLFLALNVIATNLFASNPLSLSWVDASWAVVVLGLMGLILGGWRKSNS